MEIEVDHPCPRCKKKPTLEIDQLTGRCPHCGEVFEYEEEDYD